MAEPTGKQPKWYALTPDAVAQKLKVESGQGFERSGGAAAPAAIWPQRVGCQEEGAGLARLPAPVPGFHADHPAGAAVINQIFTARMGTTLCWSS